MVYLSAERLAKSFDNQWLFQDISLGISRGEKFALVGNNGVGKSTLLKLLTGEILPDRGEVTLRAGVRLGYLTQQPAVPEAATINDVLFDASNEVAKVVQEYELAMHRTDTPSKRMQELLEKMETLKAWDYDAKVREVIGKLGVPELDRAFESLSGGQRKRVFLAKLLLRQPDLMIMDEPTNHLDLEAIEWLENYLGGQNITLIMVTHDRYFLDKVATEILELDRQQLFRYKGNYAYFLEKKAAREEALKAEIDKAKNLLRKELEWMRRQPKARGTKAKYRIEAFHELQKKASQDIRKDKLELDIKEARQGNKILEVSNLTKSFGTMKIADGFSYIFRKHDRIGIVGKNGVGKSTFLDMLTGRVAPDSGEVVAGVTTKFGYFTQEAVSLNPENRVIEEVTSIAEFITLSDGSQVSASRFLDSFLFPPAKQYNFVNKLSGGEKKRLQLLKVLVTNPNFLILDEPTNDFDIDTLNVLEDFLERFQGCLLLVSHDRYFMDNLVDRLFVFKGDGRIELFNGNYTDYHDALESEQQQALPEKKTAPVSSPPQRAPSRRKASFKEKQEYEQLERAIEDLEKQKEHLTNLLSQGTANHEQLREWSETIGQLSDEIEKKLARWMELSELID